MQEALQASQTVASEFGHQEITNEHFLVALLDQTDGVTRPLLEKMGVNVADLRSRLTQELERKPKVQGANLNQGIGNELRSTIDAAEKEMARMKDEFLSAEHNLLVLADSKGAAAKLLKGAGVTRDKLMQALQQVRGSQRVTDQNPEGNIRRWRNTGWATRLRGRSGRTASALTRLSRLVYRDGHPQREVPRCHP